MKPKYFVRLNYNNLYSALLISLHILENAIFMNPFSSLVRSILRSLTVRVYQILSKVL